MQPLGGWLVFRWVFRQFCVSRLFVVAIRILDVALYLIGKDTIGEIYRVLHLRLNAAYCLCRIARADGVGKFLVHLVCLLPIGLEIRLAGDKHEDGADNGIEHFEQVGIVGLVPYQLVRF